MGRLRIAIDMDEVIVDTFSRQLDWFRERYGHAWTRETFAGKRLAEIAPAEHFRAHVEALDRGELFEELPAMPGSLSAVRELAESFEVFIATAAMEHPGSFAPKYRWLRRHLPFIPASHYVFCGDKAVIAADFLIDDNAFQFERFAGEGILYSAPHNAGVTGHVRVSDWDDVRRLFAGVGARANA